MSINKPKPTKYVKSRTNRRSYSESLRIEVANQLNSGKMSVREVVSYYNVPQTTARSWSERYHKGASANYVEVVMKDQSDELEKLRKAVADLTIELTVTKKMLEFAGKDHGFEVKKNISTGALELVKKK